MRNTLYYFPVVIIILLSSCKKCPYSDVDPGTPNFAFYLLNKETNLPLITNDSTTTFPRGSIKLIDKDGNGWDSYEDSDSPFGPIWSDFIYPYSARRNTNDTSRYFLHFLTTGEIDTIKVYSRIHENECSRTYTFRFFYNNEEVLIDSVKHEFSTHPSCFLTLKKQL